MGSGWPVATHGSWGLRCVGEALGLRLWLSQANVTFEMCKAQAQAQQMAKQVCVGKGGRGGFVNVAWERERRAS